MYNHILRAFKKRAAPVKGIGWNVGKQKEQERDQFPRQRPLNFK